MTNPRTRLIHARLWLGSETHIPAQFLPGVILAIKKIKKTKADFYSNAPHSSKRCDRCYEIAALAKQVGAA